jgi:hypothetical protein
MNRTQAHVKSLSLISGFSIEKLGAFLRDWNRSQLSENVNVTVKSSIFLISNRSLTLNTSRISRVAKKETLKKWHFWVKKPKNKIISLHYKI